MAKRMSYIVSQGALKLAAKGIAQGGMSMPRPYIISISRNTCLAGSSEERHLGLCAEVLRWPSSLHLDLP